MAWVVFDRAVGIADRFGLEAPVKRWVAVRDEIHAEVCERGFDPERRTFTQYYGSTELDASVLNIPIVGFLPATTSASPARSTRSGVNWAATASSPATRRPRPTMGCRATRVSSWPARSGWSTRSRATAASRRRALFERLIGLSNDLGLLAEEYDVARRRQVGNFPQAFSHLTLILAACAIATAQERATAAAT